MPQSRIQRFRGRSLPDREPGWQVTTVARRTTSDSEAAVCAVTGATVPLEETHYFVTHMGAWYADTQPETPLDQLVHTADMVESTESITPGAQGPIPEELEHCELEARDLR